jgi:hypothetical protein
MGGEFYPLVTECADPFRRPTGCLDDTACCDRERGRPCKGDPDPLAESNALTQDDGGKEDRGHWRNGGEDGRNRNAALL